MERGVVCLETINIRDFLSGVSKLSMSKKRTKLILSPCGTSILTNKVDNKLRPLIFKHANTPEPISGPEGEFLKKRLKERRELLLQLSPEEASEISAEINGIFRIYQGKISSGSKDIHILIATDTWLGRETARMVETWLRYQGVTNVQVWDDIAGLRTDSLDNFHCAVSGLVRRLHESLSGYKDKGFKIIFNLTGGFKSIQGILQTLSQFYADEAVYIFETGEELLRIPRLPLVLDVLPSIRKNLTVWRRLALGLPVKPDVCRSIPDSFLLSLGEEITLSPWGELIWQQCKQKIYQERFWEPPSERITFSEEFAKDVNDLPPDRRYEINKRMDELALHLEREKYYNPRSLNCHPLKGKPVPDCTHEIYAWSDRDARRIFGVCHGHKRFEIKKLEKHL